jgi:toxin ParE1/3/4
MIKWTEKARKALDEIHDYIAMDNPIAAKKFIGEIIAAIQAIEDLPQMGRIVPEINSKSIREIIY